MGLAQRDVVGKIGVNPWTILNWEKGRTEPPIAAIPAIVRFLGYNPLPEPTTLPQHLLAKRRAMGWSIKEAAWVVGVDASAWRNWERGKTILYRQHRARMARLPDLSDDALDQEMASRWNRLHNRTF